MPPLSIFRHLKGDDFCFSVDLFNVTPSPLRAPVTSNDKSSSSAAHGQSKGRKSKLSLIIDSESCLDRLYGGYYSDWASGGQWNRMISYVGNLSKACQTNNIQIIVAMRGGVEKEQAERLFRANRDFKDRLNRVILHLQNRGTPPPKVWWLPPTCLREVVSLSMQVCGIPVLATRNDYYAEVMAYLNSHNMDGILSDDPGFAFLTPPRLFAAHDFKLTYKGSLETKEYLMDKWAKTHEISIDRFPLLASLLGNHILSCESLKEFHEELVGNVDDYKSPEELEYKAISEVAGFVKKFPDPKNLDAIGHIVFRNSSISMEEGICQLKQSVSYMETSSSVKVLEQPAVVKSSIDVLPVKSDKKHRKKNAVVDADFEVDDVIDKKETTNDSAGQAKETRDTEEKCEKKSTSEIVDKVAEMAINGIEVKENGTAKLHVDISPSEAILKLAIERHSKGLMSPLIIQSLTQREVRLPCYLENYQANDDQQRSIIEIYRPIRQSIYAILHNLNKHLYDTRKIAEQDGNTVFADDITISIVEHYLGPLGAQVNFDIKVKPVPWPVPSVESLWLGVKPENKQRRMKAYLSCMDVGPNPPMTNNLFVPERFLLICTVLRYLLKSDCNSLTESEVDAVLAMATSQVLFDVQTMQDMQLPLITPRGAHVASLVMAGIQHAMLVNDACGAPIRKQMTYPWLYFDGKLLQYKLLKASSSLHARRLDLCDGQMAQVIIVERLRQAVMYGLEDKSGGDKSSTLHSLASALPGGRMFATPAAFLRPNISSAGRGKGSLMGEFMPVNQTLDARGGKLQVAGQVVATWGPRPGSARGNNAHASNARQPGFNVNMNSEHAMPTYRHANPKHYQAKKPGYNQSRNNRNENKNKNTNNSEPKADKKASQAKAVMIASKAEKDEELDVQVMPDATGTGAANGEEGVINNSTDSGIHADTVGSPLSQ